MLTGHVPYEGETPISQAVAHILEPVPDILSLRPDLSGPYKSLLNRVLAKNPKERFGTMTELLRELRNAEQNRQTQTPATQMTHDIAKRISPERIVEQPNDRKKWSVPLWVWLAGAMGGFGMFIVLILIAYRLASNMASPVITPTNSHPQVVLTNTHTLAPTPSPTLEETPTLTQTPTNTLTPTPTLDPNFMVDDFGIPMVLVPAGSFQMGGLAEDAFLECQLFRTDCERGSFENEEPIHSVTLDAFFMDQFEITNEQYAVFLNATGNQEGGGSTWLNSTEDGAHVHLVNDIWQADPGFENHPVIFVTWFGAKAFCEWRGAALPTEAQWEKAARGGLEDALYPWGDEAPVCDSVGLNGAQHNACGGSTVPVGSFAPNGFGLYDMAGNVYEWVEDWFSADYYASSPEINPTGPEGELERRVMRGGSWTLSANNLRVAGRGRNVPDGSFRGVGFRCVSVP